MLHAMLWLHAKCSWLLAAMRTRIPLTRDLACVHHPPTPACSTCAVSLEYNNLNDDAKRLLQDANGKRSTPAILEL